MRKTLFLLLIFFLSASVLFSQNFFRGKVNHDRKYILLANPTAANIGIIVFLMNKGLLDLDTDKVNFVGVYYPGQVYDFSKSLAYIKEKNLSGFFMHEIKGKINEGDIFRENGCTSEFRDIFENSIGIFFFGGPDISPSVYGEENKYSVITDPNRHFFETTLLFHLLGSSTNPGFKPFLTENPGYLVTGFCLGMQTMNVATGGTLYQDIPAQVYGSNDARKTLAIGRSDLHRNYWQTISDDSLLMSVNIHPVQFTGHPFFKKIVNVPKRLKPMVYTSHHQSVNKVGAGFEVTALSSDGKIVEGISHKTFPNVFAVQFHPENPALYEDRQSLKFSPADKPQTIHDMLNRKSLNFHKKYWKHISSVIDKLD